MTSPSVERSALYAVTAAGSPESHLVASGPDLPGTRPGLLPPATLCGGVPEAAAPIGAGEIDCLRCLDRSTAFMSLPGWSTLR